MKPIEALTNYQPIIDKYIQDNSEINQPKYKTNQIVKISRSTHPFKKEQNFNWSDENYRIIEARAAKVPYYRLELNELDYDILHKLKNPNVKKIDLDLDVKGIFYEPELLLIN